MPDKAKKHGAPREGGLLICATPIGNMGDITQRVVEALEDADVVYAEDTRVTRKLMTHHGLDTPVLRCDENVTSEKIPEIVGRIAEGQVVAFVSDAGMPCVSDPGQRVVDAVRAEGMAVTVLPGPSAVPTAVAGSGFAGSGFYFGGFMPRKVGERARKLQSLIDLDAILVFFESNHRTAATMRDIAEAFPDRRVCLARELTKIHEEYLVLPSGEMAVEMESRSQDLKGEVVIVIEAPQPGTGQPSADPSTPEGEAAIHKAALELAAQDGMGPSKVAKILVSRFGITRDEAYRIARL